MAFRVLPRGADRPVASKDGYRAVSQPAIRPDRRDRVRRAGHRDRAEAGRLREFYAPRTSRRDRRGLAGKHLPRRGLRHPVTAVLVLLRTQSTLAEAVLAAAGDPRV